MPNWCYSMYKAVGDKEQLRKLHDTMYELECMEESLHENGFGTTWLGNLVIKLGEDWEKVYCRGSWDNLLMEGDEYFSFTVESAWGELNEVRKLIEKHFPGVKLYYQCEEPGMCIYQTNDDTGEHFPERYLFWIEDGENLYHRTLEDLIKDVEEITHSKHLKTFNACKKAVESYSRKHHNCCYTLEEFSIVYD